jgi:arylsulfate sulfotransferase
VILRRKNQMLLLPCFTLGVLLSGCHNPSKSLISNSTFDFGQVVVPQASTRDVVTVINTGKATTSISATVKGDPSLKLDPGLSCGTSLLAGGSCSMVVSFTPTTPGSASGSLVINFSGGISSQKTVSLKGNGVRLSGGQSLVTTTANPLVALYSYQPTVQGMLHVEFGTGTNYGTVTSSVATPSNGGPVQIFVAGMKQNTTYHMRAVVTESNGTVLDDADHTFTTSSFPSKMLPTLTATTAAGQTPQPGIELVNASNSKDNLQAYATDLSGNIIWGYNFPDRSSKFTFIQPIKQLPNGNYIVVLGYSSQFGLPGEGATLTPADENVGLIREIDLAGDPVAQLTLDSLNAKLAAAGHGDIKLIDLHHDIAILPDGHFVVFGSVIKAYTNLVGYPGTTNVMGDVLVDLDQNFNVSWVWNGFDHLDVNRHPIVLPKRTSSWWSGFDDWVRGEIRHLEGKHRQGFPSFEISFPDWMHSNAVLYSASDGNLVISIRHQNWIIKIDYENGKGSGNVLWRLGNDGDFKLVGGTAPEDWFYGQHEPSFVGNKTAGQFSLTMMDNGYGRIMPNGSQCTSSGPACYSTIPVIAVDEAAKTAAITYKHRIPASKFNLWGGNAEVLANGDLEYDLCAEGKGSEVDEVKMTHPAQPVWTLKESGANLYRAHRIPSLYPGVQW